MKQRRLCVACKKRPAIFLLRGKVKRRADHDLCQQCHRSQKDRTRQHE